MLSDTSLRDKQLQSNKKSKKMGAGTGAALISGGAGILGGAIDSGVSIWRTNKEIKARKKMAEYGYKKDLEMWNRQNVYNMPSSQMARLKQAGLNPNLVYGTGTVTGNTGGQMPKYNQPTLDYKYEPPNIAQNLQQFSSFAMQQAQTKNIDADTISKLVDARVNTETVQEQVVERHQKAAEQTHDTRLKELARYEEVRRQPYYKKGAAAEIKKTQAQAGIAEQDLMLKKIEVELREIIRKVGIGSAVGRTAFALLRTFLNKR